MGGIFLPGWLHRLRYKFGKFYITNLILFIIIGQIAVYAVDYIFAARGMSLSLALYFDRALILQGQVWRVITFIFVPLETSPLFMLIYLYFIYFIGREVEREWGGFFFNLFYLFGVVGTIIGGFIMGYATIEYINLSIFLVYASMFPEVRFLIFFIIPVKAKYLAIVDLIVLAFSFIMGFWSERIAIIISLINVVIFFWGDYTSKISEHFRYRKIRENFRREMWR
jgi:hypothetical protein